MKGPLYDKSVTVEPRPLKPNVRYVTNAGDLKSAAACKGYDLPGFQSEQQNGFVTRAAVPRLLLRGVRMLQGEVVGDPEVFLRRCEAGRGAALSSVDSMIHT